MKSIQIICLILLVCCGCGKKSMNNHKEEILEQNRKLEHAFNNKDSEEFARLWDGDGIYVNVSSHKTLRGRDQITDNFKKFISEEADYRVSILQVDFIDETHATELGHISISYLTKGQEERAFKAVFNYQDGKWVLSKLIEADFLQTSTHYRELKPLDWMIGNWEDESDWIDVSYKFYWDHNNNFIVQDFKMKVLDEEELSGRQVIGWDPVSNTIRSWIFDSDGGFGECKWTQEGNSWYVSVHFTLSDGRVASALHIYKKINDDTYTFSSVDRDVGGKILPDSGPFNIVRKR